MKLRELDFYGERFICFRAIDPTSPEAVSSTRAMRYGSGQLIKTEETAVAAPPAQQREPLQPVQRLLNQSVFPPIFAPMVMDENNPPDTRRLPVPPQLKHEPNNNADAILQQPQAYCDPKLGPNHDHGHEDDEEEDEDEEDEEDYFDEEVQESQNEGALFHPTHLQQLIKAVNPETLEKGVQKGLNLLERVNTKIGASGCRQAETTRFLTQIENLRKQVVRSRTIVGVVGNTGAGKSSVINAVLEEEKLLPTNCLRACTAVVTEVSWNDNDDPAHKYRAEIEFIKEADWAKELKILFDDLLNDNGEVSRDATTTSESEAGIAYAKLKAVYPKLTKEDMGEATIESLLRHSAVKNLFGTIKRIHQKNPEFFYQELQKYVDSKDKGDEKSKGQPKALEYWPLIKQVSRRRPL